MSSSSYDSDSPVHRPRRPTRRDSSRSPTPKKRLKKADRYRSRSPVNRRSPSSSPQRHRHSNKSKKRDRSRSVSPRKYRSRSRSPERYRHSKHRPRSRSPNRRSRSPAQEYVVKKERSHHNERSRSPVEKRGKSPARKESIVWRQPRQPWQPQENGYRQSAHNSQMTDMFER